MKFLADNNLGKLVRLLRIAGFETEETVKHDHGQMIEACQKNGLSLLTSDHELVRKIWKEWEEIRVLLITTSSADEQVRQVFDEFGLVLIQDRMFTLCTLCNARLVPVTKEEAKGKIPLHAYEEQERFWHCPCCGKYYWPGTHWIKLIKKFQDLQLKSYVNNSEIEKQFLQQSVKNGILFQNKIKGLFKKYDLKVKELDVKNKNKRPDFLVTKKTDESKKFICECKYITSTGMIKNGSAHASSLDPKLIALGKSFEFPELLRKPEDILKNEALVQYREYIKENPKDKKLPFIVAFGFDSFADEFDLIPKDIFGITEISAIMKLVRNSYQLKYYQKFDLNEPEKIDRVKLNSSPPPESVQFEVVLNINASIEFQPFEFLKDPIIIKRPS